MISIGRAHVVLLLALSLGACGSSPKTHFYTLGPVPAAAPARPAASGDPIVVGHVELPATLDRQSMVTRGPGDRLIVSDQDRWAAPLDQLVQSALTQDLRARLSATTVLAPGDPTPPDVRIVVLNMQRFIADESGQVVLDTDWTVQQKGRPETARHEVVRATVAGVGGEATAAAMSRTLGELADRIAASL